MKADIANVSLCQAKVKGKMKKRRRKLKTPWQKMVTAIPSLEKKSEEAQKALENMKKKSIKDIREEMTVGGGNISGLGGINGEPGIRKGKFAGKTTFMFGRKQFLEFQNQSKKDYKWWKKYLGENDSYLEEVRKYARQHPGEPIIFECEETGHLFYARYGKK